MWRGKGRVERKWWEKVQKLCYFSLIFFTDFSPIFHLSVTSFFLIFSFCWLIYHFHSFFSFFFTLQPKNPITKAWRATAMVANMLPAPPIQVVRTMRMAPEPALDNSLDIHFLQLKQQQRKNTQHNKQKNKWTKKQTNKQSCTDHEDGTRTCVG